MNDPLAYEHLCKKQVMTPSVVHTTYIDWFLPLQMFERHILMVRKIALLFGNFCIIFDCCSTQPWLKSYLQIQKKKTFNFSLEFLVHFSTFTYRNVTRYRSILFTVDLSVFSSWNNAKCLSNLPSFFGKTWITQGALVIF